jgi:quinoprotein glucose dehydrogenase
MSRIGAIAYGLLTALMSLFGLVLVVGGAWLIVAGGSWFYLIAGVAFFATAVLVGMGRSEALVLYAVFVLGTLAWALWEAGFDWWPLAARGDVVFVVGVLLLLPFVTRRLGTFRAPGGPMRAAPTPERCAARAWR